MTRSTEHATGVQSPAASSRMEVNEYTPGPKCRNLLDWALPGPTIRLADVVLGRNCSVALAGAEGATRSLLQYRWHGWERVRLVGTVKAVRVSISMFSTKEVRPLIFFPRCGPPDRDKICDALYLQMHAELSPQRETLRDILIHERFQDFVGGNHRADMGVEHYMLEGARSRYANRERVVRGSAAAGPPDNRRRSV